MTRYIVNIQVAVTLKAETQADAEKLAANMVKAACPWGATVTKVIDSNVFYYKNGDKP